MSALQNKPRETNVRLFLSGTPVPGIAFGVITVKYRKTGDTSFSTKTMSALNWLEMVNGFYILKWDGADMDTLGPFLFQITGAGFDPVVDEFDIDPVPLSVANAVNTCVVSGNIVDLGGAPDQDERIVFLTPAGAAVAFNSLVSAKVRTTIADLNGNFAIELLRGIDVIVEIEGAGIKHKITVPDQSTAALLDLLPPIT